MFRLPKIPKFLTKKLVTSKHTPTDRMWEAVGDTLPYYTRNQSDGMCVCLARRGKDASVKVFQPMFRQASFIILKKYTIEKPAYLRTTVVWYLMHKHKTHRISSRQAMDICLAIYRRAISNRPATAEGFAAIIVSECESWLN